MKEIIDNSLRLKAILILLISGLVLPLKSQQVSVSELRGYGGTKSQNTEHIACDDKGNTFVYGRFNSSLALNNVTLNASQGDAFLAAFNTQGNLSWIKQLKNISLSGLKIVNNQLFAYGGFRDSAKFEEKNYVSIGGDDALLIIMSLQGEYAGEKTARGLNHEFFSGLAVDDSDNLYLAATLSKGSVFNGISFEAENNFMLLAKYDANLNLSWYRTAQQHSQYVIAKSVSCNKQGTLINILGMAGSGSSSGIADSVSFSNSDITYKFADTYGYFIASLNENGNAQSVTGFYGSNHYSVESIGQDKDNNVYLAGSNYYSGYHITKFNAALNFIWEKYIFFYPESWFYCMKVTENGDIYTTGSFYENINFGSSTITNNLQGTLFLAKHNNDGVFKWALTGSGNKSIGTSLVISSHSDLFLTGNFTGTLRLQEKTADSSGEDDFFIAKIKEAVATTRNEFTADPTMLSVYPNPTSDKMKISSDGPVSKVNLYSASGQLAMTSHGTNEADISHLAKGNYLVEIFSGGKRYVTRIILK